MPGTRSLASKVALVTGSSRGIGAAIAQRFAEEGAKVAVHGRDESALSEVLGRIAASGGTAIKVKGDVTRFSEIESLRLDVEKQLGPIDILVANAGGTLSPPGPLEETTEEDWRASIDGNLTATFLTIGSGAASSHYRPRRHAGLTRVLQSPTPPRRPGSRS